MPAGSPERAADQYLLDSGRHKAVFFDAVGTLIHPRPAAAIVYAQVAGRFGSRRMPEEIAARFRSALGRQEDIDRRHTWRTDEARERQRWLAIVGEVLDDVSDPQ